MTDDITVVVPSIPTRGIQLSWALQSIKQQLLPATEVIVEMDTNHTGAGATRQRGLSKVKTKWVAFLDDDDCFDLNHLKLLMEHALENEADYAYSWFWTIPGRMPPLRADEPVTDLCDVFPVSHFTDPWDPADPRQTTITTLVRTELAQAVGFVTPISADTKDGQRPGEDWDFTLGCNQLGKISHLAYRTWYYRHWGFGMKGIPGNTSGLGSRW